ncbi:MAG: PAS domain S-box protein [Gemmatimonadota bacterium]|nr:PAS domain S-box protein [Gemmatimonadota bacterium]
MLTLRTLGRLTLEARKPLGHAASQRRTLALLALLASRGTRGLTRDHVLLYLWPESTATKARNTLNQTLYALRRDLHEPLLFARGPTLRLNPTVFRCDHWDFEEALARRDLEAGASIYQGPFLDQFTLPGAPEFEDWMEAERARLAQRYFQAVTTLAERADERGEHRAAAEWWWTLTGHDPLSSVAAAGLITALASTGDTSAALAFAKSHAELISRELGVAVDERVSKLVQHLTRSHPANVVLVTEPQITRLLVDPADSELFSAATGQLRRPSDAESRRTGSRQATETPPPSGEMFESMVETAVDLIYTTDLQGRFTYTNAAGEKLLQLPRGEIIGRPFVDFVRSDFRHPLTDLYMRQVTQGIPVTYFEFPVTSPAGVAQWVGQHVQLVLRNGKAVGILAIGRDITLRKQLERSLHRGDLHDRATRLLTAPVFRILVEHRVADAARTGRGFLLIFVTVELQAALAGTSAELSEKIIAATAAGLAAAFRRSDIIARVEPQKFAIAAIGAGREQHEAAHDRITKSVAAEIQRSGLQVGPALHISAAFFDPQMPASVDALFSAGVPAIER